jgi:hypothetical protein
MEDISSNITFNDKCDMCKADITHYNLCKMNKRLCLTCLTVNDLTCYCEDNEPCNVEEKVEGDIKHIEKIYNHEEYTIKVCSDEKYDLHSELKRENEDLKSRLERLEALLLKD